MLASLSYRNMKQQLSEYKIYWFSLVGVVALMYAFNSLIVSPTMQQLFSLFAESGNGDIGVIATLFSVVVVFALGWFVSYMMDFILAASQQGDQHLYGIGCGKERYLQNNI